MSAIRAAIFDLDGTLVDSLPATIEAFNVVVMPFLGTRLTAKEVRIVGPNYRKILGNFLPAERVDSGLATLSAEFLKRIPSVKVFPGVNDLLEDLARRGCRLAVATVRDQDTAFTILRETRLGAYFEQVYAGNVAHGDGAGLAVDPPALQRLAAELGCEPREAAFISDSVVDVEVGRKAGVRTAAVSWGYQRKEDLLLSEPDFLLEPLVSTL